MGPKQPHIQDRDGTPVWEPGRGATGGEGKQEPPSASYRSEKLRSKGVGSRSIFGRKSIVRITTFVAFFRQKVKKLVPATKSSGACLCALLLFARVTFAFPGAHYDLAQQLCAMAQAQQLNRLPKLREPQSRVAPETSGRNPREPLE